MPQATRVRCSVFRLFLLWVDPRGQEQGPGGEAHHHGRHGTGEEVLRRCGAEARGKGARSRTEDAA
jgi:hypothetical protein